MKKPLIIFEGNDGTGKSTTAWAVGKQLNLPVLHTSKPKPGVAAYFQYRQAVERAYYEHPGGVIFDRLHLGERIYGPVYRGDDGLTANGQTMLEAHMLYFWNPVIVICSPPEAVAKATWLARAKEGKEMFTDIIKWERVYMKYSLIDSDCPVIRHDYTTTSIDSLVRRIRQECKI